jgi:hypothetical protein
VKDANKVLMELFKIPPDTVSASLLMQDGVPPVLTATRFVRFNADDEKILSSARFELVVVDDQDTPSRWGQRDDTSLDDDKPRPPRPPERGGR